LHTTWFNRFLCQLSAVSGPLSVVSREPFGVPGLAWRYTELTTDHGLLITDKGDPDSAITEWEGWLGRVKRHAPIALIERLVRGAVEIAVDSKETSWGLHSESSPRLAEHRVGCRRQHMELLQLELALFERAFDLCQLGREEDRFITLPPRSVVAFSELGEKHGQPVNFGIIAGAIGQDLGNTQALGLVVKIVWRTFESPHSVCPLSVVRGPLFASRTAAPVPDYEAFRRPVARVLER
jgi:hypothetical protein